MVRKQNPAETSAALDKPVVATEAVTDASATSKPTRKRAASTTKDAGKTTVKPRTTAPKKTSRKKTAPIQVLAAASEAWSLGPLTLPHMLVRLLVAEQLYRAAALLANHPYHRG